MTDSAESSPRSLGKIVILGILGLGLGAFFYFDVGQYFSLEALKANRDDLLAYTNANFTAAVILYVAVYILQTAFSLPGGALMTLTGGFLFGSILGTIFVNIGATAGATLAFLAARYVLRDWVERKFGERIEPLPSRLRPKRLQLPVDPAADPGLSVFSRQSRVRSHSDTSRHLRHRNLHRHYSRQLCLRVCGETTRIHQLIGGNCLTASVAGVYLPGFTGSCSHSSSQIRGKKKNYATLTKPSSFPPLCKGRVGGVEWTAQSAQGFAS